MTDWKLQTPVAFLIFNRPDTTARVFAEIARAKPPQLLIVADGPRPDRPGEEEKCAAARAIVEQVDWDCQVMHNYADSNLGCKRRISSGLDWVFKNVEEGIILEDDCLPHPTFFRFCEELLIRFRDDERIMMISGDNFQFGRQRTRYSYYFSRYAHIWGWASWGRAWQHYDVNLRLWAEIRQGNWLQDLLGNRKKVGFWTETFNAVSAGEIDTWDHQWTFACWAQNGANIMPKVNLVENIGFSPDATHTNGKNKTPSIAEPMVFPLDHPPYYIWDSLADRNTELLFFTKPSLLIRLSKKLTTKY